MFPHLLNFNVILVTVVQVAGPLLQLRIESGLDALGSDTWSLFLSFLIRELRLFQLRQMLLRLIHADCCVWQVGVGSSAEVQFLLVLTFCLVGHQASVLTTCLVLNWWKLGRGAVGVCCKA